MYDGWGIIGALLIMFIGALLPREPSIPTEDSKRLDDIVRSSFEQTEENEEGKK